MIRESTFFKKLVLGQKIKLYSADYDKSKNMHYIFNVFLFHITESGSYEKNLNLNLISN